MFVQGRGGRAGAEQHIKHKTRSFVKRTWRKLFEHDNFCVRQTAFATHTNHARQRKTEILQPFLSIILIRNYSSSMHACSDGGGGEEALPFPADTPSRDEKERVHQPGLARKLQLKPFPKATRSSFPALPPPPAEDTARHRLLVLAEAQRPPGAGGTWKASSLGAATTAAPLRRAC